MLTRGSDDLEVGRAGDWHEALADRVNQPSLAARQSRDGHALDECSALDTGFEDIADAFVDAAEECLEATEHPRLDHGVGRQRLHSADRVRGLCCGAGAIAESSPDVAELALDPRVRRGAGSPLLGQLGIDPLCVRNELRGEHALRVDDQAQVHGVRERLQSDQEVVLGLENAEDSRLGRSRIGLVRGRQPVWSTL